MSNDENSLENVQSNYNGAHDSESTRISNTNGEAERTTTQTYQISHSLEDHTDSDAAHTQHSNSVHTGLDLRYTNTFDVVQEAKRVIQTFLRNNSCYSLIKNSSKVVVFDVKIPINLAFFALVEHDIKSVPIWDADLGTFVGMFTATDFVSILRHFYIRGSPMTELAEHSIASWRALPRSISNAKHQNGLISITPEDSLYDSCKILHEHRLHRIPIVDPVQNSVLSILTHSGILQYLVSSFREQRRLFDQPVYDLKIGTYENIITAPDQLPLIMILHTLIERRVSAIPIINVNGVVVNIYCVSNVTELVKDRSLAQLDMPVGEVLRVQAAEGNVGNEGLHLCYKTDTLHMIFERFAAVKAHRLVCVDEFVRCVGIVSLSDLFDYFLSD
uniref:5'AMPactivated protein kinase subunit gamma putative n=1 Tax=Albugo laibachii Nc14 TaxID=890382 RepID=F0WL72_9STRA|nr:5'AMPactivated protein kinase subunit gamma putative [Albugo laibachii Nc14]|eukprot:CCA22033.1 5'AMPactivated protein kinase subunit gamma putative [Albugo laibachii Nc14]